MSVESQKKFLVLQTKERFKREAKRFSSCAENRRDEGFSASYDAKLFFPYLHNVVQHES